MLYLWVEDALDHLSKYLFLSHWLSLLFLSLHHSFLFYHLWLYGNITPTDPKAIAELKAAGILPASVGLRQVKYLNNLVEQDHRFIKRLVKPGMGFFSMETAGRTLQGYEVMNMLRKGQVGGVGKGDIIGQVTFIARLFGVAA